MQNDFVSGALGSTMAQDIVDDVKSLIGIFPGPVIFTKDTHSSQYLETLEGRNLPVPHCKVGTTGWNLVDGLVESVGSKREFPLIEGKNYIVMEKPGFGGPHLVEIIKDAMKDNGLLAAPSCNGQYDLQEDNVQDRREEKNLEIHMCGLCTDICVITNCLMLRAHFPNVPIVVHSTACAGSTKERHESALEVMKSCHVEVVPHIDFKDYFGL